MFSTLTIAMLISIGADADHSAPVQVNVPQQVTALGQTRVRLNRAYQRLCAPPLDNLDFVLADVSLQMTRRFTNYSGDISGRMIGTIRCGNRLVMTQPADWSVVPFPGKLTAERLARTTPTVSNGAKLVDLGPLGARPWKYIPATFMGTDAHWVWPKAGTPAPDQRWLLQLEL